MLVKNGNTSEERINLMDDTNNNVQPNDAPLQPNQDEGSGVKDESTPATEDKTQDTQTTEDASDRLTPDHPRFKAVLDDNRVLKEKIEAIQASISARQAQTGDEELTAEERSSIEKIDREMKKRGYVTQDQLDANSEVDRIALTHSRLSDKYNGSNGLPKYNALDVTTYAKSNGFGNNLEAAFRDMHFDAFVTVRAKQANAAPQPPSSEKATGGDRQAPIAEFTAEQIANMTPEEWDQNRSKILGAIKSSTQ